MSGLKPISGKEVIKKLKKVGFFESHQRGSHVYLKSEDKTKIVTVPVHGSKDIPIGTLYNIVIRQAGLTAEQFNDL